MYTVTTLPLEQKENTTHGNLTFPVQKYTTALSQKTPYVTPHWHEEAEFTLITKGSCTYQIQLTSYTLHAGDLIFISPMQLHAIQRIQTNHPPRTMHSETYVFHMNYLGASSGDICAIRYLRPLMKQQLIPPFIIPKNHPIYPKALALFHQLNDAWEAQLPGFELSMKLQLLSLIHLLLPYCIESSSLPQLQTAHSQKIKTALEYIAAHYTENISITDIASACYFSEYHFMRFFKKYVGMSCIDYIKTLRLEKAVELFEKGNRSILDVSLIVGFHNLSYFYREFKKKYGITPKQFITRQEAYTSPES